MSAWVIEISLVLPERSGALSLIALNAALRAFHSASGIAHAASMADSSAWVEGYALP